MRGFLLSFMASIVVLVPNVGNAQVYSWPTPPPQVSAASADWQLRGDPIFFAGSFYYPTGPTVYFDGKVMARSGIFQAVPLYTDATLEPYSMVFVPIGGNIMRPYERKREGELAGTVGSRPPTFPIQRGGEGPSAIGTTGIQSAAFGPGDRLVIPEAVFAVGTGGTIVNRVATPTPTGGMQTRITMIPEPPRQPQGLWVEFEGAKWYHNGPTVSYDPDRFLPTGSYRGFPVYMDKNSSDTIYVSVVKDGPLAPYSKR